jgi:hypothetical protein
MGMSARGWPQSEIPEIVIRGFSSDDTDAERDAARRGLIASVTDDARTLLYRLSFVMGRFDRTLALKIAEVPPPIQRPGELLDSLIGPWIENVSTRGFRVSPLAANAGHGMLTNESQEAIHASIALQMLLKPQINATEANGILTHGLLGKVESVLSQLAYSTFMADGDTIDQLRDQFFTLPLLRTDAPVFPSNLSISILLRLAQFRLVASSDDMQATAACVAALLREISEEKHDQLRGMLESLALGTILNTIGIASSVPNWVDLLQRFRSKLGSGEALGDDLVKAAEAASREVDRSFFSMLFSIGASSLPSVRRVEEIFLDLDRLSDVDRSVWFESFESHPADYGLLVNPSWLAEANRNELNAADAAERFKRMALMAGKWQLKSLAGECYIARAVMIDEYINDKSGALTALDEAEAALGNYVPISRARSRIHWRNHEYHDALQILRGIADVVGRDSPIDRAFAMREASISAAKTGEWTQAATWFGEADKAAAASGTDDMHIMAIGLEADRAVALLESGNAKESLRTMASCLKRLSKVAPSRSLRAGYCHRVVRHTILWMDSKLDNRQTLIDGKPIQMLPGTCSNPEPPAAILDLPLAPLDAAWYMLAEAETSYGGDAGIVTSFRSELSDGPISLMEATLRNRQIINDIVNSNVAGFSQKFLPYLAAVVHLHRQRQSALYTFDPINLLRGEIPPLSADELAQPETVLLAIDAVTAFCMCNLFRGTPDRTRDLLRGLMFAAGQRFPGEDFLEKWFNGAKDLAELNETVMEGIAQLRSGEYLTPRQLWEIGLRFNEKIGQSSFRNAAAPLLRNWLREQWKDIVANGAFRLERPMQTVPAIEESLSRDCKDEAFIASLLLSAAEAVGSPLAAAYEVRLRGIAKGDR